MFGLFFRLLALAGFLFSLMILATIALVGYLVVDGGRGAPGCATAPAGGLDRLAKSLAFDAKLAAFVVAGGSAPVSSVGFEEAESAARAERFFEDHTDRVNEVLVCFHDGKAEGFLKLETVFGREVGVTGTGTLDLSGPSPRIDVSRARFAGLPIPGVLTSVVEDRVNEQLEDVVLRFPMSVTFEEGRAVISRSR